MFFIGLFSGYIPYLILLAVSSLCMVTFTIGKVTDEKENPAHVYAEEDIVAKITDEKCIHFDDVHIEVHVIPIDEEKYTPVLFNRFQYISFSAHRKKHFNTFYSSLFPNPPPVPASMI
jgi:hypothetical protein